MEARISGLERRIRHSHDPASVRDEKEDQSQEAISRVLAGGYAPQVNCNLPDFVEQYHRGR